MAPPCWGAFSGVRARWALFAYAMVMTTLVAGVVYGWQSFRAVFIEEGVLGEGCAAPSTSAGTPERACPKQAKDLGTVFACGAWSVQACRMVTGIARDRFGTRVTVVGVMLVVAVGITLLGVASPSDAPALGAGYFLMGIGAGVQLCAQSVSTLFGEYQGTASAALSGAFTASAAVPMICAEAIRAYARRRIHRDDDDRVETEIEDEAAPTSPSAAYADARRVVMLAWAGVVVLSAASALWLMPRGGDFEESERYLREGGEGRPGGARGREGREGEKSGGDREEEGGPSPSRPSRGETEKDGDGAVPSGGSVVVAGATGDADASASAPSSGPGAAKPSSDDAEDSKESSAWAQLRSADFILLASWFTVMLLPTNFFIISVGDQLESLGDADREMTRGFSTVWVLSTLVSPLAGYSADVVGRGPTMTFAMACYAASFAMIGWIDRLPAQWVTFCLFNVGRLWVFSMYFVSVGKLFGFRHYGTLAGAGLLASAVSTPLAVPMLRDGVDHGWARPNAACVGICVAMLPYTVGWTWRREREKKQRKEIYFGGERGRDVERGGREGSERGGGGEGG